MIFLSFACGGVAGLSFSSSFYILNLMGWWFVAIGFITSIISTLFRLNDIGWSRWLFLLNFVPYVNILFFIVILFSRGRE